MKFLDWFFWWIIVPFFIGLALGHFTHAGAAESETQKAKLIDCQSISIDETFLPHRRGKYPSKHERLVCFWRITVNDPGSFPVPLILWKEAGTENYGFVR